jgi:hypothetical protein
MKKLSGQSFDPNLNSVRFFFATEHRGAASYSERPGLESHPELDIPARSSFHTFPNS